MIKVIIVKKKFSDNYMNFKQAHFFDEDDYDIILKEDTDVYYFDDNNKRKCLLKFRKNKINKEICQKAFDSFHQHSKRKMNNRGPSAGYLNQEGAIVDKTTPWRGKYYLKDGSLSKITMSNSSASNIAGYYDRPVVGSKDRRPCRITAFNLKKPQKWIDGLPFIREMDKCFKELNPDEYKKQKERAELNDYHIKDTAYSTITLNDNFRTALHKDAGDFEEGFGNLCVIEKGTYQGGYTGFPQFGVAVDVRTGDYLSMDVHQWHCNTKINGEAGKYNRLAIVAYLRKGMNRCPKKIEPP